MEYDFRDHRVIVHCDMLRRRRGYRLLSVGIPIDAQNYDTKVTALHEAIAAGQYETAKLLIEARARSDLPNAKGMTPLDLAVKKHDERMVEVLRTHATK